MTAELLAHLNAFARQISVPEGECTVIRTPQGYWLHFPCATGRYPEAQDPRSEFLGPRSNQALLQVLYHRRQSGYRYLDDESTHQFERNYVAFPSQRGEIRAMLLQTWFCQDDLLLDLAGVIAALQHELNHLNWRYHRVATGLCDIVDYAAALVAYVCQARELDPAPLSNQPGFSAKLAEFVAYGERLQVFSPNFPDIVRLARNHPDPLEVLGSLAKQGGYTGVSRPRGDMIYLIDPSGGVYPIGNSLSRAAQWLTHDVFHHQGQGLDPLVDSPATGDNFRPFPRSRAECLYCLDRLAVLSKAELQRFVNELTTTDSHLTFVTEWEEHCPPLAEWVWAALGGFRDLAIWAFLECGATYRDEQAPFPPDWDSLLDILVPGHAWHDWHIDVPFNGRWDRLDHESWKP